MSCKKKEMKSRRRGRGKKQQIPQVTQTEKQKGESIVLSLGLYTALLGVDSY